MGQDPSAAKLTARIADRLQPWRQALGESTRSGRREKAMNHQQTQAEPTNLRALEETSRKTWRPLEKSAAICASLFAFAGFASLMAGLVFYLTSSLPQAHAMQQIGLLLCLACLPMSLLRQALSKPR
jgi:hypothetical protein